MPDSPDGGTDDRNDPANNGPADAGASDPAGTGDPANASATDGTNDTDSATEGCANHDQCTLAVSADNTSLQSGGTAQITATGANGDVSWSISGTSTLDTTTGDVVTLTAADGDTANVTATDGNGCTASVTITVGGTITSQTVATAPGDPSRTTIGVGEEVNLTYTGGDATWAITANSCAATPEPASLGTLTGNGSTASFQAGYSAGSVTITATGATTATITFNIEAPASVSVTRLAGTNLKIHMRLPSCGWQGTICVLPNDVSFYNVQIREQDSNGVGTGCYIKTNGTKHGNYASGYSDWVTLGNQGDANGNFSGEPDDIDSWVQEEVVKKPPNTSPPYSPPFNPGTLTYNIILQWQVVGSSATNNFPAITQTSTVTADGHCTTSKGGHSETTFYTDEDGITPIDDPLT